ncbi:transporter substrate-binding domain-containing protein [Pectobacterium sp. B1J-3]|uniref:transporter substrate-binding domain-containing protein n=1 Tax=Pectobacterium sp. B1J-3 TaxID=3385371 RepID=UPI003906307A
MKKFALMFIIMSSLFSNMVFSAQEEVVFVGALPDNAGTSYLDKDGYLTGYEVEVLREVDRRLPEYRFEYKTMDFASLFMGLGSRKLNVIIGNIQWSKEREDKFLYTKEKYYATPYTLIVKGTENNLKSLSDINGKKIGVLGTGLQSPALDQYIEKNKFNVNVIRAKSTNELIDLLVSGRADGLLAPEFHGIVFNKYRNRDVKSVGKGIIPIGLSPSQVGAHLLLNKDDVKLRDRLDVVLAEMHKDGTLSKLSLEWFGRDFTVPFDVEG